MNISFWETTLLCILFFSVALLYSRAGLGGGSSYLALLALFGFPVQKIPSTALLLNLLVASQSWKQFSQAGFFEMRLLIPFLVTSLPASFVGARWRINDHTLGLIFAAGLLLAGIRFLIWRETWSHLIHVSKSTLFWIAPPVGMILGFLAGMIGIGGGIFLGPILIILGWATPKQAAACSSAFIVLNSATGLAAKLGWRTDHQLPFGILIPLAVSVVIGGWIGAKEGAWKISPQILQKTLGIILILVGLRFAWQ